MMLPSLLEQVEARVVATPDAVAVAGQGGTYTYRRLWDDALSCRDHLSSRGVGPGDVVALLLPRGAELAAAVFGVWLAGAAYLPIDTDAPPARQQQVLDDARPAAVFDSASWAAIPAAAAPGDGADRVAPPDPEAPAYVIYTSGTTGTPKGVVVPHRALANLIEHLHDTLGTDASTRMLWLTKFSFDMSVPELFLPLAGGGTCCPAPDAARADGEVLARAWRQASAMIVQGTPSTWRVVLREVRELLPGTTVMIGGESSTPELITALVEGGARVLHCYGPTETTVWSTTGWVDLPVPNPVPAGRPIRETAVRCVDSTGRPVSGAEAGEVRIYGTGVALGYHHRPELTAAAFHDDGEGRYYRTGDLGRWDSDGRLVLLGRADRQVKLLGNRIELGDVEAALTSHPQVDSAAAEVVEEAGERLLGALVQPAGAGPGPEELLSYLQGRLPRAMLPSRIRFTAAMPLTPNGKIDHREAQAVLLAHDHLPSQGSRTAPADSVLERVAAIWSDVLPGIQSVEPDTNFFLSGGHSLLAALSLQRIEAELEVRLTLEEMFSAPTLAAFADLVAVTARGPESDSPTADSPTAAPGRTRKRSVRYRARSGRDC